MEGESGNLSEVTYGFSPCTPAIINNNFLCQRYFLWNRCVQILTLLQPISRWVKILQISANWSFPLLTNVGKSVLTPILRWRTPFAVVKLVLSEQGCQYKTLLGLFLFVFFLRSWVCHSLSCLSLTFRRKQSYCIPVSLTNRMLLGSCQNCHLLCKKKIFFHLLWFLAKLFSEFVSGYWEHCNSR